MTAIQRWYIDMGWDYVEPRSVTMEQATEAAALDPSQSDVWCKAKDVAELERVIAEQSKNHQAVVEGLRRQLARAKHMVPGDTFETREDDGPHANEGYTDVAL